MKPSLNSTNPIAGMLNSAGGRWIACTVVMLVWFYTVMVIVGAIAAMLLLLVAAYMLFVMTFAYSRMRTQHKRDHGHIWLKITVYLGITGWLCIAMPIFGTLLTLVVTFIVQCAYAPNRGGKVAEEGNYLEENSKRVGIQMARLREATGDPGLPFGGVHTTTRDATKNYLFAGTVGSGKSVSIQLLLLQMLGGFGTSGHASIKRVGINDPAGEMPAKLEAMGYTQDSIIITLPFDQRSRPWAISHDIRTAEQARSLANILIEPNDKATDPFWDNASRNLLVAVIRYFNIVAPGKYRLRDLVLALRSQEFLEAMFADEPKFAHMAKSLGSDKTRENITSTLINHMERYEVLAALWHKAETVYGNKPFSLTEWVSGSSILIFGRSATAEAAMKSINKILLTRLIQLLMEAPLSSVPVTGLFLDELGSLGGFKPLLMAVTELRKRGVTIVVGFQSLSHIIDNFNEHVSNVILANFNHIAGLRLSDPKTEEWLRQIFGKVRFSRNKVSVSRTWKQGTSRTLSQEHGEEDILRPGIMGDIPIFDPAHGTGLTGVYKAGDKKWWHTYPPTIVQQLLPQGDPSRNFIPMPEEYQELDPWTPRDLKRLDIEHLFDMPMDDLYTEDSVTEKIVGRPTEPALQPGVELALPAPPADYVPNVNKLRDLLTNADQLTSENYLEQQFQKLEQQYGIDLGRSSDTTNGSKLDD